MGALTGCVRSLHSRPLGGEANANSGTPRLAPEVLDRRGGQELLRLEERAARPGLIGEAQRGPPLRCALLRLALVHAHTGETDLRAGDVDNSLLPAMCGDNL